jgi:hypothetical protein
MAGKSHRTPLKYVGSGDYIPGVPTRDLTSEEAEEFGPLIEANYLATQVRLYVAETAETRVAPVRPTEVTQEV